MLKRNVIQKPQTFIIIFCSLTKKIIMLFTADYSRVFTGSVRNNKLFMRFQETLLLFLYFNSEAHLRWIVLHLLIFGVNVLRNRVPGHSLRLLRG